MSLGHKVACLADQQHRLLREVVRAARHSGRPASLNHLVALAVGQRATGIQQALAPAVRTALGHGKTCTMTAKFHAWTEDDFIATERCIQVIKAHAGSTPRDSAMVAAVRRGGL